MINFIDELYNEFYNRASASRYQNTDDDVERKCLYERALKWKFGKLNIPVLRPDLEDFVQDICFQIINWYDSNLYMSGSELTLQYFRGICCCLAYVDYQYARQCYAENEENRMNYFYEICNDCHIEYSREPYVKRNNLMMYIEPTGFEKLYKDLIQKESRKGEFLVYRGEQLIGTETIVENENKAALHKLLSRQEVNEVWYKFPNTITKGIFEDGYYSALQKNKQLTLLAFYVDVLRFKMKSCSIEIFDGVFEEAIYYRKGFMSAKRNTSLYDKISGTEYSGRRTIFETWKENCKGIKELLENFPDYESYLKNYIGID